MAYGVNPTPYILILRPYALDFKTSPVIYIVAYCSTNLIKHGSPIRYNYKEVLICSMQSGWHSGLLS